MAAAAPSPDQQLQQLQQRAEALRLHESRSWHASLHYQPRRLGGVRSSVASAWYFLAEDGHRNPRAELQATLAAFVYGQWLEIRDEPVACAMASRWAMLDEALDFAAAGLEPPDCAQRDAWLQALNPEAAHLVFPSAYLNSPASMFGHTLLRIDGAEGSREAPLLSYAVNFAADTDESNGLLFAVKGLTGGYQGRFGVMPYYEKVREYARIESRDLWEYPLHLSDAQLQRMMLHLWQLRGAAFDYYFFTRNCSLQLLALLEVALPQRDLRAGLDWYAIPTDTLRALARLDLIGEPVFRPALATTLQARAAQIGDAETARAVAIGRGRETPGPKDGVTPRQQARVLDVAHDWLYYQWQSGSEARDDGLERARSILAARAATGTRSGFAPARRPAVPPQAGHGTGRASIGAFADNDAAGALLRLRPAYHDLLDPPGGYGRGSQIQFLDTALAVDARRGSARLHELRLIDIVSLGPRDRLFQPVSWQVQTGARRLSGYDSSLSAFVSAAPGLSVAHDRLTAFLFAPLSVDVLGDLDKDYSLGGGGRAGLLWQPRPAFSLLLEAESRNDLLGGDFDRHELRLGLHWQAAAGYGLRLQGFAARDQGQGRIGGSLSLLRYFSPSRSRPLD